MTGGAGFIGAHLCRRLLDDGCEVLCVDNLSTGSRDNVADLLWSDRFHLLQKDSADAGYGLFFSRLVAAEQIYNLACPASPVHYQRDPIKTTMTNVMGARNVLEIARQSGAKVLQASTSEVYGDPQVHPQTEDYWGHVNPIGPRACYDEGKRCAETLFFDYHYTHGIKIKVARIFNTYGPGMRPDDGRVISNFIMQALNGEPLTVYGDGSQTRSFCYISDMVEGLVRLMETEDVVTGPINLGNPRETTVCELYRLIGKAVGAPRWGIIYEDLPKDDPTQRCPDISLAKATLNWFPTVSLEDGLERTIAWFSDQYARTRAREAV